MTKIRIAMVSAALVGLLLVGGIAYAASQVTGGGQTKKGATVSFVAKADHSGHLTYVRHVTGLKITCSHFHSFHAMKTKKGFPKVALTARRCYRADGVQRYLAAVFVDRGEPGIGRDLERVRWSKRWPVRPKFVVHRDRGRITTGNIQIH
jgi:hypothetical protein